MPEDASPDLEHRPLAYDACRPEHRVRISARVNEHDSVVHLLDISAGPIKAPRATLIISKDGEASGDLFPSFLDGGVPKPSIRVARGGAAALVIERAALVAALRRGDAPIVVAGMFTRHIDRARDEQAPFRIEVSVLDAEPPQPEVEIPVKRTIDLARVAAADTLVVLGEAKITPKTPDYFSPRSSKLVMRVFARLTWREESWIAASLRPHRLDQDPSQWSWRNAETALVETLSYDSEERAYSVPAVDVGVELTQLRKWLAEAGKRPEPRRVKLEVGVWFEQPDGAPIFEDSNCEVTKEIELVGGGALPGADVPEMLIVSGLCNPFSIHLTEAAASPYVRELPAMWIVGRSQGARGSADGRYARRLLVQYEGAAPHPFLSAKVELAASGRVLAAQEERNPARTNSTWDISVDVSDLLSRISAEDESDETLACVTTLELTRDTDASPLRFVFSVPLRMDRGQPDWFICIDFGASSTAIWIGRGGSDRSGMFLPLGEWLAGISPLYDAGKPVAAASSPSSGTGTRPRRAVGVLLPSNIGLSSQFNMRAEFDPLSLGDLSLAMNTAVGERLRRLGRVYDISVPFPSSQTMAEHLDAIITQPKKRLVLREDHVRLNTEVFCRDRETGDLARDSYVDLAALIEDCFHELGEYVAINALQKAVSLGGDNEATARQIERDRVEGKARFAAVVTHPSGIAGSRVEIYCRSGQRFLEGLAGPEERRSASDIKLVPEAMAAARYGIQKFIQTPDRNRGAATYQTFVALDIGAGTYDVTVVDAALTATDVRDWKVQCHFGIALGGADLDVALIDVAASLLGTLATMPSFGDAYELEPGLALDSSRQPAVTQAARAADLQFRMELQAAKAQLSAALLSKSDVPYLWQGRGANGPPLAIRVGKPGALDHWPVRLRPARERSGNVIELPGRGARIRTQREPDLEIWLEIWPEALEGMTPAGRRLQDLVRLIGAELPGLALAEHLRDKNPSRPGRPPVWIVTGRTALWPPLFNTIRDLVEASPEGGSLLAGRPFPPDEMKQAVIDGAFDLARRPWLLIDNTPPNPLAIIEFGGLGVQRRPLRIQPIAEIEALQEFETSGPFLVARIIPSFARPEGLDERVKLIQQVGVTPWVELSEEVAIQDRERWIVEYRRDATGIRLIFRSAAAGSNRHMNFGPFPPGRVYGP